MRTFFTAISCFWMGLFITAYAIRITIFNECSNTLFIAIQDLQEKIKRLFKKREDSKQQGDITTHYIDYELVLCMERIVFLLYTICIGPRRIARLC